MSFNIALSGINASQKDLDVTANNIANVSTFGFKESRAEFADVYATSIFTNSDTTVGQGVTTKDVAQMFNQGSFLFTSNSLDLAIDGSGFFATSSRIDDNDVTLTRSGAFKLDDNSFVVNSTGQYLKAFEVNQDGTVASVSVNSAKPLQIPSEAGKPAMTTEVEIGFNLPANATLNDPTVFDPLNDATYNHATSLTIYDSLGNQYVQTTYYVKDGTTPNRWAMFTSITDSTGPVEIDIASANPADRPTSASGHNGVYLDFNNDGSINEINGQDPLIADILTEDFAAAGLDINGADGAQTIDFTFIPATQFASSFEVTNLDQNGSTIGRLTSVDIANDGLVSATYSNGSSNFLGKIILIKVNNEQGLSQAGDTAWRETQNSGEYVAGEADSGSYGRVLSGTLEQSNVNLTTELVDLITAQRNFQANSRALEVNNTVSQTVLQIR